MRAVPGRGAFGVRFATGNAMDTTPNYEWSNRPILQELSDHWGWLLAIGIVLTLAGLLALGATTMATFLTVTFLGFALIVGGLMDVITAFASRRWRGFGVSLLSGIFGVLAGIILLANPVVGAGVLTLLLAAVLVVSGMGRVVYSLVERYAGWGWSLFSGLVAIVLGALVFARFPTSALWFLGLAVATELLVRGAMWIALALSLHRAAPREAHA